MGSLKVLAATTALVSLMAVSPALATSPLPTLAERLDALQAADEAATDAARVGGATLPTGNVIFIHPDGTSPSWWQTGRLYWKGPDASLFWDQLPYLAMYRGHSSEVLLGLASPGITSSSNSGATTHAFGYKVQVADSFGQDGPRPILSLSGFQGSILREAANRGHPVGVVNDGDLPEPGTGVFLAEVGNRGQGFDILDQMLNGRPGKTDRDVIVLLGGGEGFALPSDARPCDAGEIADDCFLHRDPVTGNGPEGPIGRNLIVEAKAKGYFVMRTRAEFDRVLNVVRRNPSFAPKVLGLFARDDIFNDRTEEDLILAGLVRTGVAPDDKKGDLLLYGSAAGTPGFNPPTAAEMAELATLILERRAARTGKPFMLVAEVEGTDNFGNNNNAIGGLVALKNADDLIGVARLVQQRLPNTLILTAADGDAGSMTPISFTVQPDPVGNVNYNPNGISAENVLGPQDGTRGRNTAAFKAEPDDFNIVYPFGVAWIGTNDSYGAIVSRAQGVNAELLNTTFAGRFDNTDVYRLMYATLFGRLLPPADGKSAPARP